MDFSFQKESKFALLAFNDIYVDLPTSAFQLSDGTWVMPGVPVADLGIWKEWIGSIRMERIASANLILLVEEPSNDPWILDAVHQRLSDDLTQLFYLLHLRRGLECEGDVDLLCGSCLRGVPGIRQMKQMPIFFQSKGYRRVPLDRDWLEDGLTLRSGIVAVETNKTEFGRVRRGLKTLFNGLQQTGQDRLHQFVRSLEALILPDIGSTKNQFSHRCQTFARASDDTRAILQEAFDMRSDTEHLHEWDRAVQSYPADQREDVCWQRTRQMEQLACATYSRVLPDLELRQHFRNDAAIAEFWKLTDDKRRLLWRTPIDIATEPFVQKYDQWEREV